MRCILALLHLVVQAAATSGAVNYCGARMCGHSNAHTYCKYRAGPGAACSGYMAAPLSAEEKARVLARLNRRRSQLALGWRHWPPAGDMLKLRWIEELSREAQRWADQCRPPRAPEEHDVCRDLYSISVGQCVASIVGEAPGLRPESMVDMWFMQSMLYDGNVTSYIPAHAKNYYGDFAQMMWSRTYLVGCARSRFMAEWHGRLRSVERLVCNFAPRGPVPTRPLWSPAAAASICPARSHPDTLPGLCSYQHNTNENTNSNDSLPVQDNYLLETVFEIEKNKSLDYLGSLDEIYLTKIAIATIGTAVPIIPLYYSLQKRDVFEHSGKDDVLLKISNKSEIEDNNISNYNAVSEEKSTLKTKPYTKTKVNTIGRPKPYDINELNDGTWEHNIQNRNDIQDVTRSKEKEFYAEYGLVDIEEDDTVDNVTTIGTLAQAIYNVADRTTDKEVKPERNGYVELINATDGVVGSGSHVTNASEGTKESLLTNEEIKDLLMSNKSVEDYFSDPETVRALQDALEQMERTLASPAPASTPGKVRRELRNMEAELQKISSTASTARAVSSDARSEAAKSEDQSKSKDRGPMLSMVLKYMPYLKPYESSIVGDARGHCCKVFNDLSLLTCSVLLYFCAL